jgi:hypothetical protein
MKERGGREERLEKEIAVRQRRPWEMKGPRAKKGDEAVGSKASSWAQEVLPMVGDLNQNHQKC